MGLQWNVHVAHILWMWCTGTTLHYITCLVERGNWKTISLDFGDQLCIFLLLAQCFDMHSSQRDICSYTSVIKGGFCLW